MAGNLAVIPVRDESKPMTAIEDQWEIQFSRFFNYPSSVASTCPDLVPLPRHLRNRVFPGTWIASSSPALLRLARNHSFPPSAAAFILDVSLGGKLLEEHYVSKLHFSWPQVKCISGFPARGTRALFVSYRDGHGEIQKFCIRFSTTSETEAFINSLKDILKDERDIKPFSNELGSAISSQPQFLSSNRPPRASEVSRVVPPVVDYVHELPTSSIYRTEQPLVTQETIPLTKFESNFAHLPPSFTSMLTDFCPFVEQAAPYPTVNEDMALKSQIAKYMEDASFQDMLIKVERVINEMGGGEYTM